MLLTLCRLPFIWRGAAVLAVALLVVQMIAVVIGLVQFLVQEVPVALALILALYSLKEMLTVTMVSASAVFCENLRLLSLYD